MIERQKMGLHVIQNPSGSWGFVGSVPGELAFEAPDGGPADPAEIKNAASFGSGFAKVKARSWPTVEDAIQEADAQGYEVMNAPQTEPEPAAAKCRHCRHEAACCFDSDAPCPVEG